MRRKKQEQESVVPPDIMDGARRSVTPDRARPARRGKCKVCGDEVAPTSTEELCWVCRRLKISAWRDADHQMPAID